MRFDWDDAKRTANVAKHGLDFIDLDRFDWKDAAERIDGRRDYGEVRLNSVGRLDGVLVNVTFTMRGNVRRIISVRRESEG